MLDYQLVVLTHGTSATLHATLSSFIEHVTPKPESVYIRRDGAVGTIAIPSVGEVETVLTAERPPIGFCRSTKVAWEQAWMSGHRWVFWLEHDFIFERPVDLRDLAEVLDAHPKLAQMALCRGAANKKEHDAGGLVQASPGDFQPCEDIKGRRWLEHGLYWTTNPSLFRASVCRMNPWPDGPECEGKFRYKLAQNRPGTTFGLWGEGETWVRHIGERSGFGY